MSDQRQITMLCIATYFKGEAFLRQAKRDGCRVILVTLEKLKGEDWPHDAIDEIYYMPNEHSRDDVLKGISYLARSHEIHRSWRTCSTRGSSLRISIGRRTRNEGPSSSRRSKCATIVVRQLLREQRSPRRSATRLRP